MDCLFIIRDPDNSSIHQELVDRDATYVSLVTKLNAFGLRNFSLFYNDEEGDEVRVSSDAELRECFSIAQDNSVTFYVVPQAVNTEPSKPEPTTKPSVEKVEPFSPEWIGKQIPVLQQFVGEFLKKDHPIGNLISEITGESCTDLEDMLNREASKFQEDLAKFVVPKEAPKKEEDFPAIHTHVYCDVCNEQIVGIRYKCVNCVDYDLCQACEENNLKLGSHDPEHLFLKVYKPVSLPTHRAFPSFYNRPAGSYGWMGWTGDKKSCPWRNRCNRAERPARKERHYERKDKFRELEENMKQLQRELSLLKEKSPIYIPGSITYEPVEEPIYIPGSITYEPVEVPVEAPVEEPFDEEPVVEVNLLEQSTAGLTPELLEVFEQIIGLGFKGYPRIAELVRKHNGDVNLVVMELLNEMRQSVTA